MATLQYIAEQILGLIDLTSLNDDDTDLSIEALCKNAITPFGNVPAICIYSKFIPVAKKLLSGTKIKIATVTNFPHGLDDIDTALSETRYAIANGADEVDIVFPYHTLINGNTMIGAEMVTQAKNICADKTLKVIIESGELKTPDLIKLASEISINNGADFIKTSTGKVPVNATLPATDIMLNAINSSGNSCGFKAAGGIRTVDQAVQYLQLTEQIMGSNWINADHFRFGASGLLSDVLAILGGKNIENHSAVTY